MNFSNPTRSRNTTFATAQDSRSLHTVPLFNARGGHDCECTKSLSTAQPPETRQRMSHELSPFTSTHATIEITYPLRGPKGPVAFIALWSSERRPPTPVIARPSGGIGYADEMPIERDERGVLWSRELFCPGVGDPIYHQVHALRQRTAMLLLLCQVCGGPASHTEEGTLWLLRDRGRRTPKWPENHQIAQPPLCIRCAKISVRFCPWLDSYVAVRAHSIVTDISGIIYKPTAFFPKMVGHLTIQYRDPLSRWMQASQLIRTLHRPTFIDLRD